MSHPATRIFRCPGCGLEQEVWVWETVNVTLNPELKPRMLDGELFDFKCIGCGHDFVLVYPLLYHDMKRRGMFWLVPPGTEPETNIGFPGPGNLQAGYTLRLVNDPNELIEKVLLLDAGIDDRLMELFKLRMRREACLAGHSRGAPLYFHGIERNDQGRPQINLVVLDGDATTTLVIRDEDYREWEQEVEPLLPRVKRDRQKWLRIDRKYARRFSRSR